MGRWTPDARGRLERAALELYDRDGFDQTTATQIARRAGLSERTFFRHFADKREVLFGGAERLRDHLVHQVTHAPASTTPLKTVAAALSTADAVFPTDRELSRQRQRIIISHPGLQERELIKLATLSTALADALIQRGVPHRTAHLTAEAGIAIFKAAYSRWLDEPDQDDFAELVHHAFEELRAVAGADAHRLEPMAST